MKKKLILSRGSKARTLVIKRSRCIRCCLLDVIDYWIEAFVSRFGREPAPDEPLFFDGDYDEPIAADHALTLIQLKSAARAIGVEPDLITEHLATEANSLSTNLRNIVLH